MMDSNQFHAVCLDTYPPIFYLNDTSSFIIQLVHAINQHYGQIKVAYTFDAGPNAVLYLPKANVPEVLKFMLHYLPPSQQQDPSQYFNNQNLLKDLNISDLKAVPNPLPESKSFSSFAPRAGVLQFIQHTTIGEGPQILDLNQSLLSNTGELLK